MDINKLKKEELQNIVNDYYSKKDKQKQYSKEYYNRNREWIREKIRKKQNENRQDINEKALKYYYDNKERISTLRKINRDKIKKKNNTVIIKFD
jgi:hypothetical protein